MKKLTCLIMAMFMLLTVLPAGVFAEQQVQTEQIMQTSADVEETNEQSESSVIEIESEEHLASSVSTGTAVISGTVLLPEGAIAKAGDVLKIYFSEPPVLENGKVISGEGETVKSYGITFSAGQQSASYSTTLPEGSYTVSARYMTGNKAVTGAMVYYTADGMTENEFLADEVTAGSTEAKNLTLSMPAAESYVSGTIDLSACVPQTDGRVWINAQTDGNGSHYTYSYISKNVKAGQTSLDYEIGVDAENIQVYYNSDFFSSGYYSGGTLGTYQKRTMLDATNPVENLDIKINEQSQEAAETYNITVKFSEALSEDKIYAVKMIYPTGTEYWNYTTLGEEWLYPEKGATQMDISFPVTKQTESVIFYYRDITGASSANFNPDIVSYYYNAEKGITSDINEATNIKGLYNVTVQEPDFVTISGTLSLEGDEVNKGQVLHVGAEFGEESYSDRVEITGNSMPFEIKVPTHLKDKSFKLFTARESYTWLDDSTVSYTDITGTLTGNLTGFSVSGGSFATISGTIYLPFKAPKSGAVVSLSLYTGNGWVELGDYVVSPEATELAYKAVVPAVLSSNAYISADIEVYDKVNITTSADSDNFAITDTVDISFDETIAVSGTISLPEGVTFEEETTVTVYAYHENGSEQKSFTISAGESSTAYSINVPKDYLITRIYVRLSEEKDNLFTQNYYCQDGSMSGENTSISLNPENINTINLSILKSSSISGTITLPENVEYTSGTINYNLYCKNVNTGKQYSGYYNNVNPSAENSFKISVPSGTDEKYIISIYISGESVSGIITTTWMYYTGSSFSVNQSDAAEVSPEDNYNLYFPVGKTIKGKLCFPESGYIKSPGINLNITVYDTVLYKSYYKSYSNVTSTDDIEFEVNVPEGNSTYRVYVNVNLNNSDTNLLSGTYYYATSGTVTSQSSATLVTQGTENIVINIAKAYTLSGKINVPDDYKYIDKIKSASVYLSKTQTSTGSSSRTIPATVDENMNYKMTIPAGFTGTFTVAVTPENRAVNNIVNKSYTYVDTANTAVPIEITGSNDITGANVTVETGYALNGTIALPQNASISGITYKPNIAVYGYNSLSAGEITAEKTTSAFMVGIPKNSSSFRIYANLSNYSKEDTYTTNMYPDTVYYVSDTETATSLYSGKQISTASMPEQITMLMQTGASFNFKMQKPDGEDRLATTIYLENTEESISKQTSMTAYSYNTEATSSIVLPKANIGKQVYVYYTVTDGPDNAYKSKIYVNPDGSFAVSKSNAKMHTIGETNNFNLNVIYDDDPIIPVYVLESEHNYANNINVDYTYTHPTAATFLKVTFNEETRTEVNYDKITIYDGDGNQIGQYSGTQLSGATVKIPGNSFKINLKTDGSSNYYGFAVESVEAYNYIISSSHPLGANETIGFDQYTHTENADWLDLTFSDETMFDTNYEDKLYLYTSDGEVLTYGGSDLSGKSIRVPGNTFRIEVVTGSSGGSYGFDIIKITPGYKTQYTVTYKNYDGTVLYTQSVEEGLEAIYMGSKPYKPMEGEKAYKFKGWDADTTKVTSNMTVTAQFEETKVTEIETEDDLIAISDNPDGYYVLKNDIKLEKEWTPIGGVGVNAFENCFCGVLEGNGHIITNVVIPEVYDENNEYMYMGFFSVLKNAVVRNLGLEEISYGGADDYHSQMIEVGGLACEIMQSKIEGCFVRGSIMTTSNMNIHAGGFAGSIMESDIDDCYADVCIETYGRTHMGGFASDIGMSSIKNCFALGEVKSDTETSAGMADELGAFVAMLGGNGSDTKLSNCYYCHDWYSETFSYGTPLSMDSLADISTYMTSTGGYTLDFDNVWVIDERVGAYPTLKYHAISYNAENEYKFARVWACDYQSDKTLAVECVLPSYEKAVLVIATYKDGRMTDISLTGSGNTFIKNAECKFTYDEEPVEVKIMLLKNLSTMEPMCKEVISKASEWETE